MFWLQLLTYITRRLFLLIPVLLGVTILTFTITRAAGDPVTAYLTGDERSMTRRVQAIIEKYALDEPTWTQYVYWLKGIIGGDLGYSQMSHLPVSKTLALKFPATLELALTATIIAVFVGIRTGTAAAVRANSWVDQTTRVVSLVAVSIPVFWLGLLLLMIFYNQLGWLPGPGRYNGRGVQRQRPESLHQPTAHRHLAERQMGLLRGCCHASDPSRPSPWPSRPRP